MSEIEKALLELKALMKYRAVELGYEEEFRGLGLTSRKNLCLHPLLKQEKSSRVVDAKCRLLTATFVREKRNRGEDLEGCVYHDNLDLLEPRNLIPNGIWTLDDLLRYGEPNKQCPYFTSRRMMQYSDVIIYSHHYLLDPKIAENVSRSFLGDSIVVFDEAHNIDNVCTESLSCDITDETLGRASRGTQKLNQRVKEMKETNHEKLKAEYYRLVDSLHDTIDPSQEEKCLANPVLPEHLLREPVPGNIRKAEHFTRMKVRQVILESPASFLVHLKEHTFIERKALRFCAERLASLMKTLELTDDGLEDFLSLGDIAMFATLVATYDKGFNVILEPFVSDTMAISDPVLHFVCLDAARAIKPVFERFRTVIITSGTLSPLEMYPKMLDFAPVMERSYTITWSSRQSFLPMIVTRGGDQTAISTSVRMQHDPSVLRNYGRLLVDFVKVTPDGLIVLFPSSLYMESTISVWQGMGILDEIWRYKVILVETPSAQETSLALETYRTACSNGRGAVFLCLARGKVPEGIDFSRQYGRCVLCIGVPFHPESRILKARLEFLRQTYHIREDDFLSFDAMRHATQCLGRLIRGKDDYGVMVLADRRFERKRMQLPKWISHALLEANINLSTDMAVSNAKQFLNEMAQPLPVDQDDVGTWGLEDLRRHQEEELAHRPGVPPYLSGTDQQS